MTPPIAWHLQDEKGMIQLMKNGNISEYGGVTSVTCFKSNDKNALRVSYRFVLSFMQCFCM